MLIKDILLVSVIALMASVGMFYIGELTGNSIFPEGMMEGGIAMTENGNKLTEVVINPSTVKLGESMDIIVTPGDYGVYKKIYIYERDIFDKRIDAMSLDCIGFKCTIQQDDVVTESYRPENYFGTGDFYVKVKDGSKEWVTADFKIV